MQKYLKVSSLILITLAISRFIPHPPNFTSLIALGFYVPALLGITYIPIVVLSFAITDIFFGFHNTIFFTWGSVLLIGYLSRYFNETLLFRFGGVLLSALIFYLVSNFGVWITGVHGESLNNLAQTYTLALPFFGYTLISTLFFSFIIEIAYKLFKTKIGTQI